MCKTGDIILVKNYIDNGSDIKQHSFVVLSDENGEIQGLDYDIICNVMSSFKDEKQKKNKLRFKGNFSISFSASLVVNNNGKDGYIKSEQMYYFNKEKTDYIIIGKLKANVFNQLIEFIQEMDVEIKHITDNL